MEMQKHISSILQPFSKWGYNSDLPRPWFTDNLGKSLLSPTQSYLNTRLHQQ